MNHFFSASPTIVRSLTTLVCLGGMLAIGAPAQAETVADAPYFSGGRIHCPDGSTREYQGELGNVGMRLACGFNTPRSSDSTAQVPPAPAATLPLMPMPAQAADCGAESGITARDLTIVDIKDGKPKIDAGALFMNAAAGNKKALAALHRCAANSDAEAMALLGMYYGGKDEAKSMEWYQRAYAGGSNVGCNIAKMYDRDEGAQRNDSEAAKWYLKAAERGDAGCQYNLGLMYLEGRGVPKDMGNAIKWWRKAADQGSAGAQFNLGVVYQNGESVPVDKVQAVRFYLLACKNEHSEGCFLSGATIFNGDGVQQDKDQGVTLIRRAVELDPNNSRAVAALKKLGVKP